MEAISVGMTRSKLSLEYWLCAIRQINGFRILILVLTKTIPINIWANEMKRICIRLKMYSFCLRSSIQSKLMFSVHFFIVSVFYVFSSFEHNKIRQKENEFFSQKLILAHLAGQKSRLPYTETYIIKRYKIENRQQLI